MAGQVNISNKSQVNCVCVVRVVLMKILAIGTLRNDTKSRAVQCFVLNAIHKQYDIQKPP